MDRSKWKYKKLGEVATSATLNLHEVCRSKYYVFQIGFPPYPLFCHPYGVLEPHSPNGAI